MATNGSINWPWSGAMINKVRAWKAKILRASLSGLACRQAKHGKALGKELHKRYEQVAGR